MIAISLFPSYMHMAFDERNELFRSGDDASTPLGPEEKLGLKLAWVTFRRELNEVEQANIIRGRAWALRQLKRREILDETFVRQLHRRMFGDVWTWAGEFRVSERNIGIAPWNIGMQVRNLILDASAWIEHQTFKPDEIAVRFHHRLVFIHPFPNGNGRHSRLMADLIARKLDRPEFTWGGTRLTTVSDSRTQYIAALRKADHHDFAELLAFARS